MVFIQFILGLVGAAIVFLILWGAVYLCLRIPVWTDDLGRILIDGKGFRRDRIAPYITYGVMSFLSLFCRIIIGIVAIAAAYEIASTTRDWWQKGER